MQHWAKLREVLRAVLVPKRNEEWYTCCLKKIERNSFLYSADHTWLRNTEMDFPYAVWFLSLDEDECLKTPPVCDVNANCNNTLGSYLCFCKEGFMGDGKTCQGNKLKWWSGKHWLNENVSEKYDLFITIRNVCWVCRNSGITFLFSVILANIEVSATSFVASCSPSFNPSLCRLSPLLLLLCRCFKAISPQCRNLAKQRLKKAGQNKCNQRRAT